MATKADPRKAAESVSAGSVQSTAPTPRPAGDSKAAGKYHVSMVVPDANGFQPDARPRAGIIVSAATGWDGSLTKEQLAEIDADPYLTYKKV